MRCPANVIFLEYWQADPITKTVAVLRLEGDRFGAMEVYGLGEMLTTPPLPGLTLDLSEIFA